MARSDSYIPVPKDLLIQAVVARPGLGETDTSRFGDVVRMLGAVFHYETFDELERLRSLYRVVDPNARDGAPKATPEEARAFISELEGVLRMANFSEKSAADLMPGVDAEALQDVRVKTSEAGIRRIRFFVRGGRPETRTGKRFFLLKKSVETEIFDDVLLVIELKGDGEYGLKEARAFDRMRRGARPGAVLLKHFGSVPKAELMGLHPGSTTAMKNSDQLILGVPAIAGGIPLLTQLWNAVLVISALVAAWFGVEGQVTDSDMKRALAALSGIVALGAFLMRQRLKYNAKRLAYQKKLADTVYFHTLANNAGVIDGLVGEAEEQDLKEAVLAWWALRAGGPMERAALDAACETVLRDAFDLSLDFEIGDALAKLERLGLIEDEGAARKAVDADVALARLDAAWDGYFGFSRSRPAST
jgi:hypothetical protein